MNFTKMHGAGNDFIIIEDMHGEIAPERLPYLARKLCAAHTSLGADGLMVLVPAKRGGDYGMLFYNSDGSLGEMCGNGARCVCRYGYDNGLAGERQLVETTAGPVSGQRISRRQYRIRLNDPSVVDIRRKAAALGRDRDCAYLELGDPGLPHAIVLTTGLDGADRDALRSLGRALRYSPAFPKGANVSFVEPLERDRARILTYERGVEDFTLACGTGCGSAAAALCLWGLGNPQGIRFTADGGELEISLTLDGDSVGDIYLTGPTNLVCRGQLLDEDLELL